MSTTPRNGHPKAAAFRVAAYQLCRAARDLEDVSRQVDGKYPFTPQAMPPAAWSDMRDAYVRLGELLALAPPADGGEQT